jgi:hypothetical protein
MFKNLKVFRIPQAGQNVSQKRKKFRKNLTFFKKLSEGVESSPGAWTSFLEVKEEINKVFHILLLLQKSGTGSGSEFSKTYVSRSGIWILHH